MPLIEAGCSKMTGYPLGTAVAFTVGAAVTLAVGVAVAVALGVAVASGDAVIFEVDVAVGVAVS